MSKFIDITGERFNKLVVLKRLENEPNGVAKWLCRCDCGKETVVRGSNLKSGAVKSCGCLKYAPKNTNHLSKTSLYRVFANMKIRCYNKNSKSFKNYGGRGIKICDEWLAGFENFYNWALQNGYKKGLTIERINNDGDYAPSNCKWITKSEQPKNRTNCLKITYNGKTQILKEWCDELNLDYKLIHGRIRSKGWTFERAINTPVNVNKRNKKARLNNV